MDVKIVHHAVISWHFVCFDVATAAAASRQRDRCWHTRRHTLSFVPSGPAGEAGTGLQHLLMVPPCHLL